MKKFVFDNQTGNIYPLTLQIVDYVEGKAAGFIDDDLTFRLKTILIELLTNSLKHVINNSSIIEVSVKGDTLTIKKTDNCKPLQINTREGLLKFPQAEVTNNTPVIIYGDDFGLLKGKLTTAHQLEFITEELEVPHVNNEIINGLMEHYGLMIITRASDSFVYHYLPETNTNTYTVIIKNARK